MLTRKPVLIFKYLNILNFKLAAYHYYEIKLGTNGDYFREPLSSQKL